MEREALLELILKLVWERPCQSAQRSYELLSYPFRDLTCLLIPWQTPSQDGGDGTVQFDRATRGRDESCRGKHHAPVPADLARKLRPPPVQGHEAIGCDDDLIAGQDDGQGGCLKTGRPDPGHNRECAGESKDSTRYRRRPR